MAGEWFRTGDLGKLDEEGNIWITGRSKYVIVFDSGEKVIPDELEDRIAEIDTVEDVCIVPRKSRNKTQVGAIVYPNVEAVQQLLSEQGEDATEDSVRS
jgi:long-chain acyl-CoA synthetase